MTKFTPEQQALIEKLVDFDVEGRFHILGTVTGNVYGDVKGNVHRDVGGYVLGKVLHWGANNE